MYILVILASRTHNVLMTCGVTCTFPHFEKLVISEQPKGKSQTKLGFPIEDQSCTRLSTLIPHFPCISLELSVHLVLDLTLDSKLRSYLPELLSDPLTSSVSGPMPLSYSSFFAVAVITGDPSCVRNDACFFRTGRDDRRPAR
jgi:hypothetical protein